MNPARPEAGKPTASTPDSVAGEVKPKRRDRKRTVGATTVRRVNAKARERQDAWAEGGRPQRTEELTEELVDLYGRLNEQRREARDIPLGAMPGQDGKAAA